MAHLFHGNKIQIKSFSKKKLCYKSDMKNAGWLHTVKREHEYE